MKEKNSQANSTPSDRLGGYLAAAVGVGALAATSDAAIVNLDFSAWSGPNAGLGSGTSAAISLQALDARLTGTLNAFNATVEGTYTSTGLAGSGGAKIAVESGYSYARPRRFTAGSDIHGTLDDFISSRNDTVFRSKNQGTYYPGSYMQGPYMQGPYMQGPYVPGPYVPGYGTGPGYFAPGSYGPGYFGPGYFLPGSYVGGWDVSSPDFGPGPFLGFQSANGHYGWLEVTWNSTTGVFEILGGAFEDVAGVGIQAGAVAAVPEPAGALGTLGLLSAGMFLRRRQRAA